ncbi:uncharacterized protein LOC109791936 isoform X1 [Cajanus cajan]|uniref:Tankyrase-2 n=1 Tax=Cajanus cajan TaxID=3821 RepID=A0A151QWE7_CAJCA|nr:uncharacterized protein LOC109791936 isoform X1 [Cajanus cajan]KYP34687.1 Tankyrase-2 [Cajanus cajan]
MSNIITEGHSILRPPYFSGKNYPDWKERMKIFIKSVDIKLWLVIKNGPTIPTKTVNNVEVEKSEDEYDEEDIKNMQLEAKTRNILYCAMNKDDLETFSTATTAKQMWDDLERDKEIRVDVPPTPQRQSSGLQTPSNSDVENQSNSPILDYLQETREALDKFLNLCVPLHKHALMGNWAAAKAIIDQESRLKHAAIASGWHTLLHVAAGANQVEFVQKLLNILDDDKHVALQDMKGNTAFCFAAASGNMPIVESLMKRNRRLPTIRGGGGFTPLQFAVMQGKCDMAHFLYEETKATFEDEDKKSLFFSSIKTGNYHLALKMAREYRELAFARDLNEETALHLLAQNPNPLDSSCHCSEHQYPININPGMKKQVIFQLVSFLWKTILRGRDLKAAIRIISTPSQVLFDAAEVGNFGFLSELISDHPSLIWEVDNKKQSIIHTAISHRQASIFNLIQEIGSHKDIIARYIVEEKDPNFLHPKTRNNTLLHLAAKLAPPGRLEIISGAALQMCHELVWFEEVKKITPPSWINLENSDKLTAQALFTKEHKGLRKDAEDWIKRTAEFCMIISTVIATGVFAAAINIPGGINDQTNQPNYLDKTAFLVFAISDAVAFISSTTSTLIFLSILISRYAEYDFHKILPFKLISGLITLFISIACMMAAFGSAFFITYNDGLRVVPVSISVLACLPMLLYIALQCTLWLDIIKSTFYCKNLFKPSKRMIYVLDN